MNETRTETDAQWLLRNVQELSTATGVRVRKGPELFLVDVVSCWPLQLRDCVEGPELFLVDAVSCWPLQLRDCVECRDRVRLARTMRSRGWPMREDSGDTAGAAQQPLDPPTAAPVVSSGSNDPDERIERRAREGWRADMAPFDRDWGEATDAEREHYLAAARDALAEKPSRCYCACGQELFGDFTTWGRCGECDLLAEPEAKHAPQRHEAEPLPPGCAWSTATAEWP